MTHRARVLILFTLLAAASPCAADAKPQARPPTSFDPDAVGAFVAATVKDKGFVGLSVAVVRDGKLVFAQGYGKKSLEPQAPADGRTAYAVGSVTKQFTCACVLLLAEEGKLSVRDKVAKYYPNLTRAADISLYDLMTHASGYPDYYPLDFVDRRLEKATAVDRLIEEYATGKLDFEPGTRWSYSNTGYMILGRVVEKASGESFASFVGRRILKPLGMEDSTFEPAKLGGRAARGYTSFALGEPEPAVPEADGWLVAAGGLWSTAPDLAKWDIALMEGKLLTPASWKLMTEPRELADGKLKGYGCGLDVSLRANEKVLRHGGAVSGFLATNVLLPRTKSAVVVLTNGDHVGDSSIPEALTALLLKPGDGPEVSAPSVKGASARDAARDLLRQLQEGKVERGQLGEEYSHWLNEEKLKGAAARLKPLGEPTDVELMARAERGGMEVAVTRLTFKGATLKGLMYRSPDGKVQQFFVNKW